MTTETNLADYKPTEEEIRFLFGDDDDCWSAYESFLADADNDYKRTKISRLLFHRGDYEGARRILDGIKDDMYRSHHQRLLGKAIFFASVRLDEDP